MKYLVLLVVAWFVWRALRGSQPAPGEGARAQDAPHAPGGSHAHFKPGMPVPAMVRCDHCGTFLPEAEAFPAGRLRFCSELHRGFGPSR